MWKSNLCKRRCQYAKDVGLDRESCSGRCVYSIWNNVQEKVVRIKNLAVHYLWYKHTKKHKQELNETYQRVMKIRRRTIGR